MYHLRKNITVRFTLSVLSTALLGILSTSISQAEPSGVAPNPLNGKLSFVSSDLPAPPLGKALKKKPASVQIYEYDSKPLGDRAPFLLVHGLRGEYWPTFRWDKVIKHFNSDPKFADAYKIYMVRYDSVAPLDKTVPQFRAALDDLYRRTQERPITVMALSLGGNLVYEGMLSAETDKKIRLLMTLGTPFRGSPLFCADWMKYSMYKNLCFPWTRIDHTVAYKLYFERNSNLLHDLAWDDGDKSVPNVGRFASRLPLGPKGDLTVSDTANKHLAKLESEHFDKKKLIAYGGYLLNSYMLPESERVVENTIMAPYTYVFMKGPAHLGREHPVLKLLNNQISSAVPSKSAADRAGTQFIYQLNDGITPVASAIFLPRQSGDLVTRETDLLKAKPVVDVRTARVFKNVDHLTYIDGYRPLRAAVNVRDELNPDLAAKPIFDWMLSDILNPPPTDENRIANE